MLLFSTKLAGETIRNIASHPSAPLPHKTLINAKQTTVLGRDVSPLLKRGFLFELSEFIRASTDSGLTSLPTLLAHGLWHIKNG